MKKNEKKIWRIIPLATPWSIWKLRNDCVFRDAKPVTWDLFELIKIRVALWFKASCRDLHYSVSDFVFNLNQIRVLDEGDWMLDMGFEPEVCSILSQTCSARQMIMFSATWPPAVHQLAQEFMDPNTVKVVVGSEDLAANHDVMQIVEVWLALWLFEEYLTLFDDFVVHMVVSNL
ncbi:hypothetical protein ACSBR1_037985 [Camellia fascicularis]